MIFTAGILGAISGLVGSAITTWSNYKLQKLKNDHDLKKYEFDIKKMELGAKLKIKIAEQTTESAIKISEMDAYKTSLKTMDRDLFDKSYMRFIMSKGWLAWVGVLISVGFGVVDFLKHLARPFITYYLLGAATWLTVLSWEALKLTGGALSVTQAFDLFNMVVTTLIYLTTTVVSWWFADRSVSKFMNKLNDGNAKSSDDN